MDLSTRNLFFWTNHCKYLSFSPFMLTVKWFHIKLCIYPDTILIIHVICIRICIQRIDATSSNTAYVAIMVLAGYQYRYQNQYRPKSYLNNTQLLCSTHWNSEYGELRVHTNEIISSTSSLAGYRNCHIFGQWKC